MTPARYQLIMDAFDHACALSGAELAMTLARLERDDPAMAIELRSLLEMHGTLDDAFDSVDGQLDALELDRTVEERRGAWARERGAAPRALIGVCVAARYRIDAFLGAGAMGRVFRAFDLERSRDVAIKLLRAELVRDPMSVRRFRREFEAIAGIDHPGCVSVYAEGEHAQERYIVMEYVDGGDLDRMVGAPNAILLPLLAQVAEALACVHDHRIVHRDIKPANILLTSGEPALSKLADFGVVKVLDEQDVKLTATGAVVGTIDYMAPEQLCEAAPPEPRSDLYSLGCVLYRLWTEQPLFLGPPRERLRRRLCEAAPRLRALAPRAPEALDELVARLLQRSPDDRPTSAREVADALAEIAADEGRARRSFQVRRAPRSRLPRAASSDAPRWCASAW